MGKEFGPGTDSFPCRFSELRLIRQRPDETASRNLFNLGKKVHL